MTQLKAHGRERVERIREALAREQLDLLVCTLPVHVLMLTGYWPVVGTSIAVACSEGQILLLAPEDERELAEQSWADEMATFQPGTLDEIRTPSAAAWEPLRALLQKHGSLCKRVGYERTEASEPASYAAMNLYAGSIIDILRNAVPSAAISPADRLLAKLAAVKTPYEVECVRRSCLVAAKAFDDGAALLRDGMTEYEAAAVVRTGFSIHGQDQPAVTRADGFAWCMSGPNSARAKAAYAHSTSRRIDRGDLVLMHANSYTDGYWTDITRTYLLSAPDARQRRIYEAVIDARAAALAAIRPGARAADVDRAAREVMEAHGFADNFAHCTGHGVGFAAISANAHPRIHPKSDERLETGMTFNVEPAAYFEGYGGVRHCDMVAVTSNGCELLTPFHSTLEELVVRDVRQLAG